MKTAFVRYFAVEKSKELFLKYNEIVEMPQQQFENLNIYLKSLCREIFTTL